MIVSLLEKCHFPLELTCNILTCFGQLNTVEITRFLGKKFKSHRGDRGYEESLVCMLFLITNLPGPLPQCRWLILSNRENKNR